MKKYQCINVIRNIVFLNAYRTKQTNYSRTRVSAYNIICIYNIQSLM